MDMFRIFSLSHNTGLVDELWHESILSHDNLDRPSRVPKDQHVQVDKENSELFRNTRVRTVIPCQECTKPRCVLAAKLLSTEEKAAIAIIDDSRMFSCGMPIFVSESPLHKTIVVCQKSTCTSPIEAQYYSAKLVKLSPVRYKLPNYYMLNTFLLHKVFVFVKFYSNSTFLFFVKLFILDWFAFCECNNASCFTSICYSITFIISNSTFLRIFFILIALPFVV